MLNIAIGLSLLIGIFLSPGSNLLALFIDMDLAKHGLKPYQYQLLDAAVNIWITAAVVYSIINITNLKNKLLPTKKISITILLSNIVIFLYIAARIFASTVEGGGGSYVVMSFSIFTFLPATIALGIALILLIKKFAATNPEEIETRKSNIPLNAIVVISAIIPTGYVTQLLLGDGSPYGQAQTHESTFDAYCKDSGEKIFSSVNESVESLYVQTGDASFSVGKNGKARYSGYGEIITPLLSRGNLKFVEFDNTRKTESQSKYLKRTSGDTRDSAIETLSRKYSVVAEKLVSDTDRENGIRGERVRIVNLQTGEVVAQTTYFFNKPLWLFCGHAPDGEFSTAAFIKRVIPFG